MRRVVYTVYSAEGDMTFIMEDLYDDAGVVRVTEVKGFYFGKGDAKDDENFYGTIRVTF